MRGLEYEGQIVSFHRREPAWSRESSRKGRYSICYNEPSLGPVEDVGTLMLVPVVAVIFRSIMAGVVKEALDEATEKNNEGIRIGRVACTGLWLAMYKNLIQKWVAVQRQIESGSCRPGRPL